jgi:hypothetical protein
MPVTPATVMPEEAKAVPLCLGHHYPFKVGQALDAVTGKRRR